MATDKMKTKKMTAKGKEVWVNIPLPTRSVAKLRRIAEKNERPLMRQCKWIIDKFLEEN